MIIMNQICHRIFIINWALRHSLNVIFLFLPSSFLFTSILSDWNYSIYKLWTYINFLSFDFFRFLAPFSCSWLILLKPFPIFLFKYLINIDIHSFNRFALVVDFKFLRSDFSWLILLFDEFCDLFGYLISFNHLP